MCSGRYTIVREAKFTPAYQELVAYDYSRDKEVALWRFCHEFMRISGAAEALVAGCDAARRVSHQALRVPISVWRENKQVYASLPLTEPGDGLLYRGGPVPAHEIREVLIAFRDGLSALHKLGLCHGYLTPHDVCRQNGNYQISGGAVFGFCDPEVGELWRDSKRYLSPEVIQGLRPTPAADVYSTAVFIAEMASGMAGTPVHKQIRNLARVDHGLAGALLQGMEVDPAKRSSLETLMSAVLSCLHMPLGSGHDIFVGETEDTEDEDTTKLSPYMEAYRDEPTVEVDLDAAHPIDELDIEEESPAQSPFILSSKFAREDETLEILREEDVVDIFDVHQENIFSERTVQVSHDDLLSHNVSLSESEDISPERIYRDPDRGLGSHISASSSGVYTGAKDVQASDFREKNTPSRRDPRGRKLGSVTSVEKKRGRVTPAFRIVRSASVDDKTISLEGSTAGYAADDSLEVPTIGSGQHNTGYPVSVPSHVGRPSALGARTPMEEQTIQGGGAPKYSPPDTPTLLETDNLLPPLVRARSSAPTILPPFSNKAQDGAILRRPMPSQKRIVGASPPPQRSVTPVLKPSKPKMWGATLGRPTSGTGHSTAERSFGGASIPRNNFRERLQRPVTTKQGQQRRARSLVPGELGYYASPSPVFRSRKWRNYTACIVGGAAIACLVFIGVGRNQSMRSSKTELAVDSTATSRGTKHPSAAKVVQGVLPKPTIPSIPSKPSKRQTSGKGQLSSAVAPAAISPRCPKGMSNIDNTFCMSTYESPGMGELPQTGMSLLTASAYCQAKGARLCTEPEWTRACEGPAKEKWPYGRQYEAKVCNVRGTERMVRTGQFSECLSAAGVFDMSGNAAEWVANGKIKGGSAFDGTKGTCQGKSTRNGPSTGYADVGFRCCLSF